MDPFGAFGIERGIPAGRDKRVEAELLEQVRRADDGLDDFAVLRGEQCKQLQIACREDAPLKAVGEITKVDRLEDRARLLQHGEAVEKLHRQHAAGWVKFAAELAGSGRIADDAGMVAGEFQEQLAVMSAGPRQAALRDVVAHQGGNSEQQQCPIALHVRRDTADIVASDDDQVCTYGSPSAGSPSLISCNDDSAGMAGSAAWDAPGGTATPAPARRWSAACRCSSRCTSLAWSRQQLFASGGHCRVGAGARGAPCGIGGRCITAGADIERAGTAIPSGCAPGPAVNRLTNPVGPLGGPPNCVSAGRGERGAMTGLVMPGNWRVPQARRRRPGPLSPSALPRAAPTRWGLPRSYFVVE